MQSDPRHQHLRRIIAVPISWSPPTPMLASLGQPPAGDGWAFEMKWDGQRAIAMTRGGQCRLFSRNRNDITATFPELPTAVLDALRGRDAIIDCEIVALDSKGRPSFSRLQRRMHVQKPTTELREGFPVVFYVFDVLEVDGESTTSLPYVDRRATLDSLVEAGPRIQVPPYWTDVDGRQMLDVATEHGLEGVVAKRADSTYLPGRHSPTWTKTPLRNNTEVVPIGWVDGAGTASGGIGGLLIGAYGPTGNAGCWNLRNSGQLPSAPPVASPPRTRCGSPARPGRSGRSTPSSPTPKHSDRALSTVQPGRRQG